MKIQDVFDHLSYGEFSQLSIGGGKAGEIDESNYARVVSHIQLGLTALYKRFNLKESRISFPLVDGAETYSIDTSDLLRIERVITDTGSEVSINDHGDEWGVFTPALSVIRLAPKLAAQGIDTPDCLKTANLIVAYRANHPKIIGSSGVLIAETKTIELPPSHLEALLYFVASRVNNPIGMTNEFHSGNTWFSKYETECRRLESDGFMVQETEGTSKLRSRGFV